MAGAEEVEDRTEGLCVCDGVFGLGLGVFGADPGHGGLRRLSWGSGMCIWSKRRRVSMVSEKKTY